MKKLFQLTFMISILTLTAPLLDTAHANASLNNSSQAKEAHVNDPLESINRSIFSFNEYAERFVIRPTVKTYRFILPERLRGGISNVLDNMAEPVTFVNAILQADPDRTFTSFWRFTINSTFGLAGLFDIATIAGLPERKEDFGQTLGHYGVGEGFYLVLPIFGPSNGRDLTGRAADYFTDPFNYSNNDTFRVAYTGLGAINKANELLDTKDEIDRIYFDTYAATRSLYSQHRRSAISNSTKW